MKFTTMRIDEEVLKTINKMKKPSRTSIGEMETANTVLRRVLHLD